MEEILNLIKLLAEQFGITITDTHASIILGLIALIGVLYTLNTKAFKFWKTRKLSKDLHPFYTKEDVKKAVQYYIQTNCQNIPPSNELEPRNTHAFVTKNRIIPFFIKTAFNKDKDDCRFYMILADSGMGKTTFMINLYLKYSKKIKVFGTKYKIELLPLGYHKIDEEIDKIEDKENTILLLDAFDEDNKAVIEHKTRLSAIMDKVWKCREVIITCRTQFFPSEKEEPKSTGIMRFGGDKGEFVFQKLYISPFDDEDVNKYIKKKFSILRKGDRERAFSVVKQAPNLMIRPMLLSYIDDLMNTKTKFDKTYKIYDKLIEKWICRESERATKNKNGYKDNLYKFSETIAINIYQNREKRNGLFVNKDELQPLAKQYDICLEDWEMKGRSLLNRNAQGQLKFSHKSILEYFLAKELLKTNSGDFYKKFSFEGMDYTRRFFIELGKDYLEDLEKGYFANSDPARSRSVVYQLDFNKKDDFKYLYYYSYKIMKNIELNESQKIKVLKTSAKEYFIGVGNKNFKTMLLGNEYIITEKSIRDKIIMLPEENNHLKNSYYKKVELFHNKLRILVDPKTQKLSEDIFFAKGKSKIYLPIVK